MQEKPTLSAIVCKDSLRMIAHHVYWKEIHDQEVPTWLLLNFLLQSYPCDEYNGVEAIFNPETVAFRLFTAIESGSDAKSFIRSSVVIPDLIYALFFPYLEEMICSLLGAEKVHLKISWNAEAKKPDH